MQRLFADSRGQAILEFALATPFLFAFLFFIMDAGLFAYTYVSMTNAVREGARCAAVGGTDGAVQTRVTNTAGGLTGTLSVPVPQRGSSIGSDVTVRANYTYDWITPVNILPGVNLANTVITRSATMRMETTAPYGKTTC